MIEEDLETLIETNINTLSFIGLSLESPDLLGYRAAVEGCISIISSVITSLGNCKEITNKKTTELDKEKSDRELYQRKSELLNKIYINEPVENIVRILNKEELKDYNKLIWNEGES